MLFSESKGKYTKPVAGLHHVQVWCISCSVFAVATRDAASTAATMTERKRCFSSVNNSETRIENNVLLVFLK